ncbi:MAG: hypothetical protein ACI8RZ_007754 [Myxococcota bacterium]
MHTPASKGSVARELIAAAILSVGVALLCAFYLARFHLPEWPVVGRDFVQVCVETAAIRDGTPSVYPQRTPTSGMLPGLLARWLGIVDGLLVGALLSCAAVVGGVYLWARSLANARAAAAAAVLVGAFTPLAVLPRFVHFYPEVIAVLVGCMALAGVAARWPGWGTALLAGLGAGAALLVDGRGLLWAVPALLVAAVALRRWSVLLLPGVAGSYLLAGRLLPPHTPRLETQIAWFIQDLGGVPPELLPKMERFLWGHSALTDLPSTVGYLLAAQAPSAPGNAAQRAIHIDPWLAVLAVGLIAVCWVLRETPKRLVVLAVTSAPFVLALYGAATGQVSPRHLAMAWPFAPVVLGVGLSAIRVHPAWLAGGGLVVAIGLTAADFGGDITQTPDVDALLAAHPDADPAIVARLEFNDPVCRAAIAADLAAGHPWGSRLYRRWPPIR